MRKILLTLGTMVMMALPSVVGATTGFDITDPAGSTGLKSTGDAGLGTGITAQDSLSSFIGYNVIQPVFGLVGLGFLCLTVYAGVLWMTARGEPKQLTKAKDILVTSVIGVVIILASYTLTTAVFNAISTGSVNGTTPVSG